MAQGTFKLPGGGQERTRFLPQRTMPPINDQGCFLPRSGPALETGPTTRWLGPETLVDVMLEGCEVSALADSGSQVNTMMPEFIQEWGHLVLPLDGIMNYPLYFGWAWWSTHMSLGICNCKTSSQRSGRV